MGAAAVPRFGGHTFACVLLITALRDETWGGGLGVPQAFSLGSVTISGPKLLTEQQNETNLMFDKDPFNSLSFFTDTSVQMTVNCVGESFNGVFTSTLLRKCRYQRGWSRLYARESPDAYK